MTHELVVSSAESDLTRLVRLLIGYVSRSENPRSQTDDRTVMLDMEVAGVRCLLVEVQPGAAANHVARTVLTRREHEIARMVANGCSNKVIATILGISSETVSTHIRRIFLKLGVHTRAAMAVRVVEDELGSVSNEAPLRRVPQC
jgi:DNA-binding CsgD family transcriptional regulator